MSSKIRLLDESDLIVVEQIANQFPYNSWSKTVFADCLKGGYLAWVIDEKRKTVGFLVVLIHKDECQLMNIGVEPKHWRQGYGKKLLTHLFTTLKSQPVKQIMLEVRASNIAAINLYQSMGFVQVGIRKGYYQGEDGYMYCKLI